MRSSSPLPLALILFLAVSVAVISNTPVPFYASVQDGIGAISGVDLPRSSGISGEGVRETIVSVLNFLISFLALIAVIAIIVAGFVFIFGAGSDTSVERGKKIIIYTIIGLIVIFFARVIVGFIQDAASGTVN